MLGRLNARARFRAMAEESIPLSSLSLGESSSSSQAASRVAASKNLIYSLYYQRCLIFVATSLIPPDRTLRCRCQIPIEIGEILGNAILGLSG